MKITFNKLTVPTGYIYISLDDGNTYDRVSIDDIKNNNNAYNLSDTQDYSKIKIKSNSTIISNLDVIKSISVIKGISTVKSPYSNDNLDYLSYLAKGELKSDTTSEYPNYYQVRTLDDGTNIIYVNNLKRGGNDISSTFNTALLTTPYIRRIVLLEEKDRISLVLRELARSIYNYSVMEPIYIENYKLCIPQYFANVNISLSQAGYSVINEGRPYQHNQQSLYLYKDSEKNIYFNDTYNFSDISLRAMYDLGIEIEWEDDTHFIITRNIYGPINTRYMVVD